MVYSCRTFNNYCGVEVYNMNKPFPELEELIDHLVYINKDNYLVHAQQEILEQTALYGRVVDKSNILWNIKNHIITVLFWDSVMN